MSSLLKNVASQNLTFCMLVAATGAASTSSSTADITAYVTKDGTQAAAGGTFTSLGPGTGQWNYAPTQTETNATNVGLFVTKTSCIPCNLDFHTDVVDANGFKSVNIADVNGTTVSTATAMMGVNVVTFGNTTVTGRDIGASVLLSPGTGTGSILLSSGQVTVVTNNDKTGYTASTVSDKTGYALSSTDINDVADGYLDRDMSLGVDSGSSSVRTPRQSLRAMRNKIDASSGTTLIVYKEDDTTVSWTASITASSGANPIVTLTPP